MDFAFRVVEVAAGSAVVLLVLTDVFQSVILPRAANMRYRLSSYVSRYGWRGWQQLALRIRDADKREDFMATFAPSILCALLVMWVSLLTFGYGLVLHAIREQVKPLPHLGDAIYYAGTSLLTIGYGDFAATSGPARFISLMAGASGLGIVAILTAFLFQIFAAFQEREVFVVSFGTRAGAPPSGVTLLEAYARMQIFEDLKDVFDDGQRWAARVMDSHLAYPILAYFRSSHDNESWIATVGALLDATTLMLTVVKSGPKGHAKLMSLMGRHLVHDLSRYFRLDEGSEVGVERAEFDTARLRLAEAGLEVWEADEAWDNFVQIRSVYAKQLNAMAHWWRIPPAQWVGDRSSILTTRHAQPLPDTNGKASAAVEPVGPKS